MLRETAHGGATVVMVAHDPRIIPYADRVYRLEDGRLLGVETPTETAVLGAT